MNNVYLVTLLLFVTSATYSQKHEIYLQSGFINYKEVDKQIRDYNALFSKSVGLFYASNIWNKGSLKLYSGYRDKNYLEITHAICDYCPAEIQHKIHYLEFRAGVTQMLRLSKELSIGPSLELRFNSSFARKQEVWLVNGLFREYNKYSRKETRTPLIELSGCIDMKYQFIQNTFVGIRPFISFPVIDRIISSEHLDMKFAYNWGVELFLGRILKSKKSQ